MSDNPLDRIPSYDRVSIRAVVVNEGEDVTQALSEAGIFDPIALPMVFGEDQPDISFGDGITPNLIAVLESDQQDDGDSSAEDSAPGAHAASSGARPGTARTAPDAERRSEPLATNLPPAYGMQPLAPVRRRS